MYRATTQSVCLLQVLSAAQSTLSCASSARSLTKLERASRKPYVARVVEEDQADEGELVSSVCQQIAQARLTQSLLLPLLEAALHRLWQQWAL